MLSSMLSLVLALPLISGVLSGTYEQIESISGSGFYRSFSYEAIPDPTHGRVNYVDRNTARAQNLTYASGEHFVLRADYKTRLGPGGAGRNSVRILSKRQYGVDTVAVFNLRHMPQGCGTWPAIWTVGSNWPNNGEIDILEGVNDQGPNGSNLHTNRGCTMPTSRSHTGTPIGNDCNTAMTNNEGCGVKFSDSRSYGRAFNNARGGWYAMERTNDGIKVWFWSRQATNVPADVSGGEDNINTSNWGTPSAYFPSTSCNMDQHFKAHNIVINLTFCGDWAGAVYGSSGCPGSCADYVNRNPSAFTNAYFDFQWIKTYGSELDSDL